MANQLFSNHTYSLPLPAPFDGAGITKSRSDVKSLHRPASTRVTLHAPTLRAAITIIKAQNGLNNAAIGRQGDTILLERENSSGAIEIVVYDWKKGTFKASILADAASTTEPYSIKKNGKDGTALLMAVIVAHSHLASPSSYDTEQHECFYKLSEFIDNPGFADEDEVSKYAAMFCDNIYTRITSADTLGRDGIKAAISSTSNIQPLTRLSIDQATYAPEEVFAGEFRVFSAINASKKPFKPIANSELPGKYAFSERDYSPTEQDLIPEVPEWYIVPKEIIRICEHACETTANIQSMRNFMMRGPAGVGKTEGARTIAAALNLPYLSLTCSANTEVYDLLGQILPDVDGMKGDEESVGVSPAVKLPKLPTFEDIQMDAATAYQMLTGTYDENITEHEVYEKLIEVAIETAAKQIDSNSTDVSGQKFRYVETPLVRAMKNGYLIEIQEPSVIANPGVLVGLNSLLDNCKKITLPTGETITRHPDTIVVITTNNDYAGCRDMNQSIISRMNLVIDIDEPTEREFVSRVSAITGYEDEDNMKLMASIVKSIQTRCREAMITDGSCGMRELISWAQSTMITGNMVESAMYTILSSASADPESREDIFNTCIAPKAA